MARFDPARIRHNFERACGGVAPALPARVTLVAEPRDPRPEARRLLEEILLLSKRRYPEHWRALEPFFAEAERLMVALDAGGETSEPAPSALRDQLRQVLCDLEDLLEVFAEVSFG
jgi:hypothetical protein